MNIAVTLIRHAKTQGNLEKRYIGRTNQPITAQGQKEVEEYAAAGLYPPAGIVFSSPLFRCLQTAEIIFPQKNIEICNGFQETDFGRFEGKNFAEIGHLPAYRQWIDTGGDGKYSGGEDSEDFKKRCRLAFLESMEQCVAKGETTASIFCHGGTIMAILDHFSSPHQSFYHWQIANGNGYLMLFDGKNQKTTEMKPLW